MPEPRGVVRPTLEDIVGFEERGLRVVGVVSRDGGGRRERCLDRLVERVSSDWVRESQMGRY